ncbi:MAG: NADH:flavin oxidoreductase, partial [Chloroflexi bacterium]|nr:NADH:flavin oxidoreductase [Chloroflexota bacterium]
MAQAQFKYLFSPLKIGTMTVRNRIVSTPHHPLYDDERGLPGDRLINYWVSKAKGGIGLIGTQVYNIHPATGFFLPFRQPDFVARMKRAVDAVHKYDTRITIQLWHAGSEGTGGIGRSLWAPSPVPSPHSYDVPHQIDEREIKEAVHYYVEAAAKVREAGADGVELHGAHGYLPCEFLSPYSNRRTDEYGGSLENRMRFVVEIIDGMRATVGKDYTVGIRLSADEFVDGGLTLEEMKVVCRALERTGKLDYLSISAGNYRSLYTVIAPMYVPLGAFVYAAAAIKEVVDLPVFCIGRINDPVQAEKILSDG